jgi:hypothetical protein
MMYQVIAEEHEVVACGGNIIPVNDCEVRMGSIRKYRPPKSAIAPFQTVEYLRAFLAGRLGWAFSDSCSSSPELSASSRRTASWRSAATSPAKGPANSTPSGRIWNW